MGKSLKDGFGNKIPSESQRNGQGGKSINAGHNLKEKKKPESTAREGKTAIEDKELSYSSENEKQKADQTLTGTDGFYQKNRNVLWPLVTVLALGLVGCTVAFSVMAFRKNGDIRDIKRQHKAAELQAEQPVFGCNWTPWTWTYCDKTCGNFGVKRRVRNSVNQNCTVPPQHAVSCNRIVCPQMIDWSRSNVWLPTPCELNHPTATIETKFRVFDYSYYQDKVVNLIFDDGTVEVHTCPLCSWRNWTCSDEPQICLQNRKIRRLLYTRKTGSNPTIEFCNEDREYQDYGAWGLWRSARKNCGAGSKHLVSRKRDLFGPDKPFIFLGAESSFCPLCEAIWQCAVPNCGEGSDRTVEMVWNTTQRGTVSNDSCPAGRIDGKFLVLEWTAWEPRQDPYFGRDGCAFDIANSTFFERHRKLQLTTHFGQRTTVFYTQNGTCPLCATEWQCADDQNCTFPVLDNCNITIEANKTELNPLNDCSNTTAAIPIVAQRTTLSPGDPYLDCSVNEKYLSMEAKFNPNEWDSQCLLNPNQSDTPKTHSLLGPPVNGTPFELISILTGKAISENGSCPVCEWANSECEFEEESKSCDKLRCRRLKKTTAVGTAYPHTCGEEEAEFESVQIPFSPVKECSYNKNCQMHRRSCRTEVRECAWELEAKEICNKSSFQQKFECEENFDDAEYCYWGSNNYALIQSDPEKLIDACKTVSKSAQIPVFQNKTELQELFAAQLDLKGDITETAIGLKCSEKGAVEWLEMDDNTDTVFLEEFRTVSGKPLTQVCEKKENANKPIVVVQTPEFQRKIFGLGQLSVGDCRNRWCNFMCLIQRKDYHRLSNA